MDELKNRSRNHSDDVGEGNEHRATKGSAFLCRQGNFYTGYYRPKKSKELDSLGVDLLTFLANGFSFPTQVKSRYFDLATHYRNYPYIHGIALNGDRDTDKIGLNLGKTINEHGEGFFTLVSCVPPDMHGGKEKRIQRRESPLFSALTEREPMVAYYHEAMRGGEIRGLGATGLVFLRNGFALFLRREIKDLPLSEVPCLPLPTSFDAKKDAAAIVSFVREAGATFFD